MAYDLPILAVTGAVIAASWGNATRDSLAATGVAAVTTAGDITQATGLNAIARLPIGAATELLAVNAGATAVEYIEDQGAIALALALAAQ